jgi:hypothetical protein
MNHMNGNLPQKRSSVLSLNPSAIYVLQLLLLMMAGAFAMFLHYKLRIPLNIPGHHGLEFMAIFTIVRLSSNIRWAATVATLGAGILLLIPGMGSTDPLHSFSYMLPGIMLDVLYITGRKQMGWLIFAAIGAGIAYMCIPLSRLFVHLFSGYPVISFFKHGIVYAILSFFFFGMLGGVLGFGLDRIRLSFTNQKPKE